MYSYTQVLNGITKYMDNEILIKMTGVQKWVIGSCVGIALSKGIDIFNDVKENQYVKMFNLVDKEDKIDVDTIYVNLKKEAQKGAITFDAPIIGCITLNETDVDKLYEYIKSN